MSEFDDEWNFVRGTESSKAIDVDRTVFVRRELRFRNIDNTRAGRFIVAT